MKDIETAEIELYENGNLLDVREISPLAHKEIKYLDYLDLSDIEDFFSTHGEAVVNKMLFLFDRY